MFERSNYGFWRQTEDINFEYTEEYREKQSTNAEMVYLRLGWLLATIKQEELKNLKAVDVGAGNCATEKTIGDKFLSFKSYDIVGESISREELLRTSWDIAFFTDVIEHMDKLEDFLEIPWKFAYISFPETPLVDKWEELKSWRHFKPGEHIWMLNKDGMHDFLVGHNINIYDFDHPEDVIRVGQYEDKHNITSMVIGRGLSTDVYKDEE